jgi:hypothetical protein
MHREWARVNGGAVQAALRGAGYPSYGTSKRL